MKNRSYNLDLLRIISMAMVVFGHFFNHGGLVEEALVVGGGNWFAGNIVCAVLCGGELLCTAKWLFSMHLEIQG